MRPHLKALLVLLLAIITSVSCDKINDTSKESKSAPLLSITKGLSLSNEAMEVSDLLDKGSYLAAETLFNNYLPKKPTDGSLYCQYVRFLIEAYDLYDDQFISTPLRADDKYRVFNVTRQAASLAVEFEPGRKTYLSEIILDGLFKKIQDRANNKDGYIRSVEEILGGSILNGSNHIHLAWLAIEYDPDLAKKWAIKYQNLVPLFARAGKASSALVTANLAGDLATAGTGDQDFEKATNAFEMAVLEGRCEPETLSQASKIYLGLFGEDCKNALTEKRSYYLRLVEALQSKRADLKEFESKGLLPIQATTSSPDVIDNKDYMGPKN